MLKWVTNTAVMATVCKTVHQPSTVIRTAGKGVAKHVPLGKDVISHAASMASVSSLAPRRHACNAASKVETVTCLAKLRIIVNRYASAMVHVILTLTLGSASMSLVIA